MFRGICYEYSTERYKDFMNVKSQIYKYLINRRIYYRMKEDRCRFIENSNGFYIIRVHIPQPGSGGGIKRKEILRELGFVPNKKLKSLD